MLCPRANPDESVGAGLGGGVASYIFEVVHQSGEGLVEILVAIALQNRDLHMFREGPQGDARSRVNDRQPELRIAHPPTCHTRISRLSVFADERIAETYGKD